MRTPRQRLDRRAIQFSTSMRRRIMDEALEAAKACEADARRTERLEAQECRTCFYLRASRVAGQAMTWWACGVCAREAMWGSTGTPSVCEDCASEHQLCRVCGGDRELRTNRRKFPTPTDPID